MAADEKRRMGEMKYRCRKYKYQLVEPYTVYLPELAAKMIGNFDESYFKYTDGTLTVKTLYAWDGPSGPTVDTRDFMRGSLVHDVLYQAIRMSLVPFSIKDIADDILRRICLEDGMPWVRAWWVWRGVKRFGGSSCLPGTDEDEIQEAP